MDTADRNRHPSDTNSEWVAPERSEVERFDRYPGVKSEVAQAQRLADFE